MRARPSYVWRWAWLAASAGSLCASAASPEVSQLIAKFQGEESGLVDHVDIANEIAKVATLDDVSSLEPWLAHEDRHVRGNAAYLFAKLGDRRGLATIEGILTDYSADRRVRWQGGSLIFQGNGEEAMAEFLRSQAALDAQISQDRYYAVHLLGELRDPRTVDTLLPLLDHDEVNYKVAWALGEIGDARAVPGLIVALSNRDALVRVSAIGALEKLQAIQALPYLSALFTDPEVPHAGDHFSVGWTARRAADAIRRGRLPMGTVGDIAAVVLLYGSWVTSVVMLWLFGRALVHHRQTSFLLLLAGTICGLSYAGSMSLAPRILLTAGKTSTWYAVLQTFLLLAQMVLGIWGTAILLRDYRKQADLNRARSENGRGA